MYIYDSDMNEEWSGIVKMPYKESEMNNIDYDIDSEGDAYILAEVFDTDIPKKYIKKERNYHLEILKISEGEIDIIKIKNSKNHISSIWLKEGPNNTMYLAGFYNEEKDYQSSIDGVFLMTLSTDGVLENESYHKIPLEIINMYQKEKVQKKNEKKKEKGKLDFENLVLDKIEIQKDGSVILIGEQFYIITTTYTDANGNTRTKTNYHYNDILVTKISKNGELEWMKKLPKAQVGGASLGGMSFKHIKKDDMHYFFFLDNINNIDLPKDRRPKGHVDGRGGIFTAYSVSDEDGEVEKTSLLNFKEATITGYKKPIALYQFKISRILETEKGLVFEAYKKAKEDIMIHVEF